MEKDMPDDDRVDSGPTQESVVFRVGEEGTEMS
jgi:hypothetical protein